MYLCLHCPVIAECYKDAETNPYRKNTVQGGEWWQS